MSARFLSLPGWLAFFLILGPLPVFSQEKGENKSNVFGSQTKSEAALIGILYDLKQNQKRAPLDVKYAEQIGNFIREGWDEGILNNFFRVTKPLYTTQIFIPSMGADYAPKAFGAEKEVRPSAWVIHAGTYRFVGMADDILMVAVNGKTVLVATHPGSKLENDGWQKDPPRQGPDTPPGNAINGDWIKLGEGEVVDLDVMIGERPGGSFGAWLMVEQEGVFYPPGPVLPIFQVAPHPLPADYRDIPRVSAAKPEELWKCHQ
jgi:hypothetical protein